MSITSGGGVVKTIWILVLFLPCDVITLVQGLSPIAVLTFWFG